MSVKDHLNEYKTSCFTHKGHIAANAQIMNKCCILYYFFCLWDEISGQKHKIILLIDAFCQFFRTFAGKM